MLRRTLKVLLATTLFVVAVPLTASANDDATFKARLDPDQEVGAVVSDGDGRAEFTIKRSKVRFNLRWDDLTSDVRFAHIHCNVAGVNGAVGVTLIHEMMDPEGSGPRIVHRPRSGQRLRLDHHGGRCRSTGLR